MVTHKIDKADVVPTYRVDSTPEAHDEDKREGQDTQEEDEYSESSGIKGWQKYRTKAKNRKALKLRRQDIRLFKFNQVVLQKGLVIIDIDIHLINGQILKNSHIFSTKIDAYWKLKNLKKGQDIAPDQMIKEEYIEVSVLHEGNVIKASSGGEKVEIKEKHSEETESNFNWTTTAIVIAIILFLIFIFAMVI